VASILICFCSIDASAVLKRIYTTRVILNEVRQVIDCRGCESSNVALRVEAAPTIAVNRYPKRLSRVMLGKPLLCDMLAFMR
jgi:hypothetical protein